MTEETRRLQNPDKYYKALENLRTGQTPLSVPENKELILQFLNDAEIGRTILKGQKRKIDLRDLQLQRKSQKKQKSILIRKE